MVCDGRVFVLQNFTFMAFIDRSLKPPSYGYVRDGELYVPSSGEILREFFRNLNPLKRHNWLSIVSIVALLALISCLVLFFISYFTWTLAAVVFVYGLFGMGSYANFWVHRFCTHRAFRFRNSFFRAIGRNLAIKVAIEELHVISHHVHHHHSDQPGDPHNPQGGWLYCYLSDINHQHIRKDLSEDEYRRLCLMMEGTGIRANSYAQYLKWGSICHPLSALVDYLVNWTFWFGASYLIGGIPAAVALFGAAAVWNLAYRNFNYMSHSGGKKKHTDGIDFHHDDFSVNKTWTGLVSGEWHNNHHLYPGSARAGFLPYQIDLPWLLIRGFYSVGAVTSYRENRELFYKVHFSPAVTTLRSTSVSSRSS